MAGIFTKSKHKGYPEKYDELRSKIKNGDLILYRGSSFLSRSIQYFDDAYYNHIGVVWKLGDSDRLLTLDMWAEGLDLIPLSRRMDGYTDFCILRPKTTQKVIKHTIDELLKEWDGLDVKYDYWLLLRIALIKKTGIDITGLGKSKKFVCSEFAQEYVNKLGFDTYSDIKLITPQDFIRYIDENFDLIYDSSNHS